MLGWRRKILMTWLVVPGIEKLVTHYYPRSKDAQRTWKLGDHVSEPDSDVLYLNIERKWSKIKTAVMNYVFRSIMKLEKNCAWFLNKKRTIGSKDQRLIGLEMGTPILNFFMPWLQQERKEIRLPGYAIVMGS
jgi:hypothetical protein